MPFILIMGIGIWGGSTLTTTADESFDEVDKQPSELKLMQFADEAILLASFEQSPQLKSLGNSSPGKPNNSVGENLMTRVGTVPSLGESLIDPEVMVSLSRNMSNQLIQMGAPTTRPDYASDFSCLVEALYFEARGETLEGQRAVAEVIIHRVKSSEFPNTICGVVHQGGVEKARCQFSYFCDGVPEIYHEKETYLEIQRMAIKFLDGHYPEIFDDPTHFHAAHVKPFWVSDFELLGQAGKHYFYSH